MSNPIVKPAGASVNDTLAAADHTLTVVAGKTYLACSSVDCWFNAFGAAAANTGLYLPAKVQMLIQFPNTSPHVWGTGAGYLVLTPVNA